jgi:enterochelin esterase-like enzyme
MPHSRRDMLRLAATAVVGAVAGSGLNTAMGGGVATAEPAPPTRATTFLTGSFSSAARGGAPTTWTIARPPDAEQALRPVIALHGRNGNAAGVMDLGVEDALAQTMKLGWPPFAVVAVDGGANDYWHRRASGADAGAMVLNELLPIMSSHGVDTSRVALLGWSMGGYGALRLGALLGPVRTAAICAVSPALWTSYSDVESGAFDSYDDWASNNVFGLGALSAIPIRVDCGTTDRFAGTARQFIASLRRPVAGGFWPGGHNVTLWKQLMAPDLSWLASFLTR